MISHGDLTAITCALSDLKKADVTVTDENVVSFSVNVSNYFGPTTAEIRTYCESSVASLITTDFDNYRATVKAEKSYFDSYSQDYTESQKDIDKYKKTFDQILSLYQKYGAEKWAEHAQEAQITIQKEDVERFNRIVSKTAKLSKYSDDYMDIWLPMFCDMSASKEMFARFKANCDLDKPGVQKALERVEELYNQSEEAYISETLETMAKQIKDWATKKNRADSCGSLFRCLCKLWRYDSFGSRAKDREWHHRKGVCGGAGGATLGLGRSDEQQF